VGDPFRGPLFGGEQQMSANAGTRARSTRPGTWEKEVDNSVVAAARQHWSPATPLIQTLGRPSKREQNANFISHDQRAFAACIIHSTRIYKDALGPYEHEIRAMLLARKMVTAGQAKLRSCPTALGVCPSSEDAADANSLLEENVYVPSMGRSRAFKNGEYRLWLPEAAVGKGRTHDGWRIIPAREQLIAWVVLWAQPALELRWLGLSMGFGVFATDPISMARPIQLLGVTEYELRDPHATMQCHATASDRHHGDFTRDNISVYGPVTLINSSCDAHACVRLKDADLGMGGKEVYVERKSGKGAIAQGQEVLAAYLPADGKCWCCPALGPKRQCRSKIG